MTEFKVGDKVRVLDTTKYETFSIGEDFPFETVVTYVGTHGAIKVRGSDGVDNAWYAEPEMLELVHEPKFQVGDKVRVSDAESWASGQAGVVSTSPYANPHEVTVVFDGDAEKYFFLPEMLELIEDTSKVQVGDKVRVTKVQEFVVCHVTSNGVYGRGAVGYADPTNPDHTIEVIEKATPKFEVGQVLTTVEELEALPVGAVVSRKWVETSYEPRAWTKTEAGEFHSPGMEWDRSATVLIDGSGGKIITVVWLP